MTVNMAGTKKTCSECGAALPPAMVRCRECGHRKDGSSQKPSSTQASGIYRATAELRTEGPQEGALSLDDMLSFAEDVESNTSSVFKISRTVPTSQQTGSPAPEAPQNGAGHVPQLKTPTPPNGQPVPIVVDSSVQSNSNRSQDSSVVVSLANQGAPPSPTPPSTPSPSSQSPSSPSPSSQSSAAQAPPQAQPGQPSEGLTGIRRERSRKNAATNFPETLKAIKKALKTSPSDLRSAVEADGDPDEQRVRPPQKTWKKVVKSARKILEANFDEHSRAAVHKLCDALEELGQVPTPEAADILVSYLDDRRPIVRETAARSLGETEQQAAFEPLIKKLIHESVEMRAAVALGLGTLGDRRAIQPLIGLATEDPQMNIRAADALVRIGRPAIPELISVAEERNASNALTAIIALGRLEDSRALEVLSNQCSNTSPAIRATTIEAIGRLGESKGIRYLVRGLSDPDIGVRMQAAVALKKAADKRAVDSLIEALNDPDPDFREQVVGALSACGDHAAVPPLLGILPTAQGDLLIAVAEALGKLGHESAVPNLCALLESPQTLSNRAARLKILDALRRLKNADSLPVLVKFLHDPLPEIRERIVDTLGLIGDTSVVVELEAMLKQDRSEAVRAACARALGEIGDHESVEALEEALSDTLQVRIKAAIALGQIGASSAMLSLTAMLRDQVSEIRYHASQALAEIGDKRSIRPIEVLAVDSDPMVVRGAFKALQKLGDERTEKQVLKAAKKRGKKATAVKSSNTSIKDFFSPDVIRDVVWPHDPQRRNVVLGSLGAVLLVMFGALGFVLFQPPEKVIPRGIPLSLSFSPDGQKIVAGRSMGALEIWKVDGTKPEKTLPIDLGELKAVGYVADDNIWIAFGNQIMRYDGGKSVPVAQQTAKFVRGELSRDRSRFAIYDSEKTVYVYNTATGAAEGSLSFGGFGLVQFSGTGELFAAVSGNEIKLFDLKATEIGTISVRGSVESIAFSPDDSLLVVNHGGKLTTFNPEDQSVVHDLKPEAPVSCGRMAFLDATEAVLFNCDNGTAKGIGHWKIDSDEVTVEAGSPLRRPSAISPETNRMGWVEEDEAAIFLYDLGNGQTVELNIY
ncbi:HEAT repeat domain-containing protein [Rubinisphaera margarita]|uniref:HEAT repeat domain-containing protein n=1 Tax=Rubinisphaera margarita TaxID=2909586 RepID=UPI001EE98F34|nr:HEAT repeat domain-containing protein [Rubinisphaera margarita]MCG6155653.1 HEAT repeat domain-containing protein [Rubinisphaera margarita]